MKVEVAIIIDVPETENVSQKQIEDWIDFELGYSAQLSLNNPLADKCIEIDKRYFVSFAT